MKKKILTKEFQPRTNTNEHESLSLSRSSCFPLLASIREHSCSFVAEILFLEIHRMLNFSGEITRRFYAVASLRRPELFLFRRRQRSIAATLFQSTRRSPR